ncbi:OLC1v1000837C1 [Oldenlandia corymbosa var. corymbosa]|uniref:OLC1v1000837C1 n=1 Tax=Oldenlandia corymbosa var. corymbosa TaxID=529605 RepID=A0AAV1D4N0_OLDCO|nr:OLC1v1000837C1 [Oldenlandia corymbosa var. corymbosa]
MFNELLMEDHLVNHSNASFWSLDYGEYTCTIDIDYSEVINDNRIVIAGTEWKKLLSDHEENLKDATFAILKYDGNMRSQFNFQSKWSRNGAEIEGPITVIEGYRFKIHIADNHCKNKAIDLIICNFTKLMIKGALGQKFVNCKWQGSG